VVALNTNLEPTDWSYFIGALTIFSETDSPMPSSTYSSDTTWEYKSASLSNYGGQSIYIGFNHNSTNMNLLFLDEISIIKNNTYCNANFTMLQDSINTYSYIIYNNSSVGNNYSYFWDFGDGNTSNLEFPTHTYAGVGPYQLCLTVTDTSGCNDTFCDSLYAGRNETGINTKQLENNFTIHIYDITGRLIKSEKENAAKETLIDISSIENGIYFLTVTDGKQTSTKKFIKQ
jgi:PKD repeat protein